MPYPALAPQARVKVVSLGSIYLEVPQNGDWLGILSLWQIDEIIAKVVVLGTIGALRPVFA
jgi:hypothetical protein